RVLDGLWSSHREGVTAASLNRNLHAVVANQVREPRAGGNNYLIRFLTAAISINNCRLGAAFNGFDGLALNYFTATLLDSLSNRFDIRAGLDEALAFQPANGPTFIRQARHHGGRSQAAVDRTVQRSKDGS